MAACWESVGLGISPNSSPSSEDIGGVAETLTKFEDPSSIEAGEFPPETLSYWTKIDHPVVSLFGCCTNELGCFTSYLKRMWKELVFDPVFFCEAMAVLQTVAAGAKGRGNSGEAFRVSRPLLADRRGQAEVAKVQPRRFSQDSP